MLDSLPPYRVWDHRHNFMYDGILAMAWSPNRAEATIMIVSKDENIIEGNIGDFTFMRKSEISDVMASPMFSGDIVRFGPDSKYKDEVFVIVEHEDGLYANRDGIYISLSPAVCVNSAQVIGNVFENKQLFEGSHVCA